MQHLPPETWRWDAADIARAIRLRRPFGAGGDGGIAGPAGRR